MNLGIESVLRRFACVNPANTAWPSRAEGIHASTKVIPSSFDTRPTRQAVGRKRRSRPRAVSGRQVARCVHDPVGGRYGATMRIPIAVVIDLEASWQSSMTREAARRRQPTRPGGRPAPLKHFPNLTEPAGPGAECHEGGEH